MKRPPGHAEFTFARGLGHPSEATFQLCDKPNKIDLINSLDVLFSVSLGQNDCNNFSNFSGLVSKKVALYQNWTTTKKEFLH